MYVSASQNSTGCNRNVCLAKNCLCLAKNCDKYLFYSKINKLIKKIYIYLISDFWSYIQADFARKKNVFIFLYIDIFFIYLKIILLYSADKTTVYNG